MKYTIISELENIVRYCGIGGGYEDAQDVAQNLLNTMTPLFEVGDLVEADGNEIIIHEIVSVLFDYASGEVVYIALNLDNELHHQHNESVLKLIRKGAK